MLWYAKRWTHQFDTIDSFASTQHPFYRNGLLWVVRVRNVNWKCANKQISHRRASGIQQFFFGALNFLLGVYSLSFLCVFDHLSSVHSILLSECVKLLTGWCHSKYVFISASRLIDSFDRNTPKKNSRQRSAHEHSTQKHVNCNWF